jgi:outer membrane protein
MKYNFNAKRTTLVTIMLTLSGLTSFQSQAITLKEAYDLARSSDPLLQQSAAALNNSKENIVQAKAALLPSIDGEIKSNWQENSNIDDSNDQGYAVNLKQPVYSPALNSAYNKVKIFDDQAKLNYQISEQNLIKRVLDAYVDAMIAKSSLSTAQAQERAIKRRLDRVNAEFEVGVIAITDVHEAQASYDNTKVNLIISQGQLETSLEALQRLTQITVDAVDNLDSSYKITELKPITSSHWVNKAINENLSILSGKQNIDAAQQDKDIASAALKPSVNIQASHSYIDDNKTGFNTNNQIALVLSMPIYSGGALRSKVRQAVTTKGIEKSKQRDLIREITQNTRSLIRDIQTNVLAIKARKQSIISSQAALDAVSEGLNVGTRNIVDLLQAEQSLFSAKNEYSTSRLNHVKMLFNLEQLLGDLETTDLEGLSAFLSIDK